MRGSRLKLALSMVAEYNESKQQYKNAAAILESIKRFSSEKNSSIQAEDIDILLRLGKCYLFEKRPDQAIKLFNQALRFLQQKAAANESAAPQESRQEQSSPGKASSNSITDVSDEQRIDRAMVGLALSFKMMNQMQDVIKVLRSQSPERIYTSFKRELSGPLSALDEFATVVCDLTMQLGEANLPGGVRLATRLAADSFKRVEDNKQANEIIDLLAKGEFGEAHKLADDQLVKDYNLAKYFAGSASSYARKLARLGNYNEALSILEKYNCNNDIAISIMAEQVIYHIKRASAGRLWKTQEFADALTLMVDLKERGLLNSDLCSMATETILSCHYKSDQFVIDVRLLANLIEACMPEHSSNKDVIRLRQFALLAEEPIKAQSALQLAAGFPKSKISQQLAKVNEQSKGSPHVRKLEAGCINSLNRAAQTRWNSAELQEFVQSIEDLRQQNYLSSDFCHQIASSLFMHLSQSSTINHWNKDQLNLTAPGRARLAETVDKLMDKFASVPGIDTNTMRKLKQCKDALGEPGTP